MLQKEVKLLNDRPMSLGFIVGGDKRSKFYTRLATFSFSKQCSSL